MSSPKAAGRASAGPVRSSHGVAKCRHSTPGCEPTSVGTPGVLSLADSVGKATRAGAARILRPRLPESRRRKSLAPRPQASRRRRCGSLCSPSARGYISIVGVDRLRWGLLRAKLATERLIEDSGLPWTILRATEFHDLMLTFLIDLADRLGRLPCLVCDSADVDRVSRRPGDAGTRPQSTAVSSVPRSLIRPPSRSAHTRRQGAVPRSSWGRSRPPRRR
jgi:hypothetical protein